MFHDGLHVVTFTFDPSAIDDRALNQLRFELGDVFVNEPEKTAYLSDEEILTVLSTSATFKRAKLRLIESLLRRFSYEVDTKVADMDLKLHQRIDAWEREFKRLKAEVDGEDVASNSNLRAFGVGRPPAFWLGMNDWRPKCI